MMTMMITTMAKEEKEARVVVITMTMTTITIMAARARVVVVATMTTAAKSLVVATVVVRNREAVVITMVATAVVRNREDREASDVIFPRLTAGTRTTGERMIWKNNKTTRMLFRLLLLLRKRKRMRMIQTMHGEPKWKRTMTMMMMMMAGARTMATAPSRMPGRASFVAIIPTTTMTPAVTPISPRMVTVPLMVRVDITVVRDTFVGSWIDTMTSSVSMIASPTASLTASPLASLRALHSVSWIVLRSVSWIVSHSVWWTVSVLSWWTMLSSPRHLPSLHPPFSMPWLKPEGFPLLVNIPMILIKGTERWKLEIST
mmetsp:Transcript_15038/g.36749  ORF Transcript_15038/g.36749 Transcript_15038/m.36749 type:complete len:316 (-) Transcript_15038:287-1234(-)